MSVGLNNTATIKINIDFDQNAKGLTGLKNLFSNIAGALQGMDAAKRFSELESTITELRGELKKAEDSVTALNEQIQEGSRENIAAVRAQERAQEQAAREAIDASRRVQASMEEEAALRADSARKVALTVGIYKRGAESMIALGKRQEQQIENLTRGYEEMHRSMRQSMTGSSVRLNQRPADDALNMNLAAGLKKLRDEYAKNHAAQAKLLEQERAGRLKVFSEERARQAKLRTEYTRTANAAKKVWDSDFANAMKDSWRKVNDSLKAHQQEIVQVGRGLRDLTREMNNLANRSRRASDAMNAGLDKVANNWQEAFDAQNLYLRLVGQVANKSRQFNRENAGLIAAIRNGGNESAASLKNLARQLQIVIEKEAQHNRMLSGGRGFGGKDIYDQKIGAMESLKYRLTTFEQQMDAIFRASFRMQMVGNNMMQFARDLFRWGSDIMNVFGEFEFSMNRAAGALAIWNDATDGTTIGTDALTSSIVDLGVKMRLFPAEEVASALYFWGSTTGQVVKTQEDLNTQMTALEPIMKAAAMTNTGYETTIKGVYSILTQYYNGAIEKAKDVTEMLFLVTQKTAAEFPDLINSFKMVGPIANANAESFEEMVDLFGRLADLGIRGTMAGRGLRQLFIQAVRPSGPATKALDNLFSPGQQGTKFAGQGYKDLMFPKGEFVGVEGYVKNLAIALQDATGSQRNFTLASITTANELPILTALVVEQINEMKGLETQTKKNNNVQEEATEVFNQSWSRLANSWKGIMGSLQRSIESVKIEVGAIFADALTPMIESLNDVISKTKEWVRANPALVKTLGELAATAGAISAVGGAILTLGGTLMGMAAVGFVVIKSFAPLAGVVIAVTGAVAAFAKAVIENFDHVQSQVGYAIDNMSKSMGEGEDLFANLLEAAQSIVDPLNTVMGLLVRSMADFVAHLSDAFKIVMDANSALGGAPFKALLTAIGFLVASKTIMGLLQFAKAVLGINAALRLLAYTQILIARGSVGKAGIGGFMATVSVTRTAAIAKGIGSIRAAFMGLWTALGPVGIALAAIGAAFVAYESIPFVKDLVDGLTDKFRDLTKEVYESTEAFDGMQEMMADFSLNVGKVEMDVSGLAAEMAKQAVEARHRVEEQLELMEVAPDAQVGLGSYDTSGMREVADIKLSGDLEAIKREGEKAATRVADALEAAYNATNKVLSQQGREGISGNRWASTFKWLISAGGLDAASIDEGMAKALAVQTQILETNTWGKTREELYNLWLKLKTTVISGGIVVPNAAMGDIGFDEFFAKTFTGQSAVDTAIMDRTDLLLKTQASAAMTRIDSLAGDAKVAAINEFLSRPLLGGDDAYELLASDKISEEFRSMLQSILQRAADQGIEPPDENMMSKIVENMQEVFAIQAQEAFETQYKSQLPFLASMADAVAGNDLTTAWDTLIDERLGILRSVFMDPKYPKQMADGILEFGKNLTENGVGDPRMLTPEYWLIKQLDESQPYRTGMLATMGINRHQFDSQRAKAFAQGLWGDGKNTIPEASKEEGEETGIAAMSSWGQGFAGGLEARGGFREAIKKAMKKGWGLSGFEKMMKDFGPKGAMMKGLTSGNIVTRGIAIDWAKNNADGIIAGMKAAKPYVQGQMGGQFMEWWKLNESTLPPEILESLKPVFEWVSENINIPDTFGMNINQKVRFAVDKAMEDGILSASEKEHVMNLLIDPKVDPKVERRARRKLRETFNRILNQGRTDRDGGVNTLKGGQHTRVNRPAVPYDSPLNLPLPPIIGFGGGSGRGGRKPAARVTTVPITVKYDIKSADGKTVTQVAETDIVTPLQTAVNTVTQTTPVNISPTVAVDTRAMGASVAADLLTKPPIEVNLPINVNPVSSTDFNTIGVTAGNSLSAGIITGYEQNSISGRTQQTLNMIGGQAWSSTGWHLGNALSAAIIGGYSQNSISGRAQQTLTMVSGLGWNSVGILAGQRLGSGVVTGFAQYSEAVKATANGMLQNASGVGWYVGGQNAGRAWAGGFNNGILTSVLHTFQYVADVAIGWSPPKKGPLKDIDKGGWNVGDAWGDNMGLAARKKIQVHARAINDELRAAQHGSSMRYNSGTEVSVNNKREVHVIIDVTSKDGSVNKVKQSEIRRGVMDAMVASDLEHFVTVG
jgi:TP901 family phage tail tape measure protein